MDTNLIQDYRSKKELINKLKYSLNGINKEKEQAFHKKEALKKEISNLVFKIKEFKSKRDVENNSIGYFKKQRDKYNSEVKTLINNLKDLNEEKTKILKKYNFNLDPSRIYEKINELERKVEIEADYKKEKKLMDEIKKLKKVYGESKEAIAVLEKINNLSSELKNVRGKADEFHSKFIEIIKDKPYSNFIKLTKQINTLKKEQEEAFNHFIELKNKFIKYNTLFKSNLNELDALRDKIKQEGLMNHLDKEEIMKEMIHEKSRKTEEKLRKGGKLTTDDLLAFQSRR